jgi:uncharacterized membrane protein HdeD (DUF308 family)
MFVLGDLALATLVSTMLVVAQPVQGAMILTFVLGLLLMGSGIVRIIMAIRHWGEHGWIMILSGIIAVLAGLIILTRWPVTGIWVLGLLLAIDLISHGVAWLTYGSLTSGQATVRRPFNQPLLEQAVRIFAGDCRP